MTDTNTQPAADAVERALDELQANSTFPLAAACRNTFRIGYGEGYRAALAASVPGGVQEAEIARLKSVIERDRTAFCAMIGRLEDVVKARQQLGEGRAASGYAYDEDGFIEEFAQAYAENMRELRRMHSVMQSFTDSPRDQSTVDAAQAEAMRLLDCAPTPTPAPTRVNAEAVALRAEIIRLLDLITEAAHASDHAFDDWGEDDGECVTITDRKAIEDANAAFEALDSVEQPPNDQGIEHRHGCHRARLQILALLDRALGVIEPGAPPTRRAGGNQP